ncbi:MAG: AsmA-like C-terminal region-containing protein, partial [Pseudolabrys sp.]
GPFKGEGAATVGGELFPFRLAAGRYGDDGALKLHVNVDPVSRPLSIEADGMLGLAGAEPKFDGTLNLTRPVGIASRSAEQLTQPWRVSGKIKITAASALMQQFEFRYGSEAQGFKLTGVADFKFGKAPRFDGVLSGRQIDLDRALASGDGTSPPPAAALRKIAELAGGAFRPAIPIQIGVGIDQVTLGGNSIANLRGDISSDAKGWNLDRFEFRAPGFTQVRLSGQLAVGKDAVSFAGPAEINAGDPKALAAWLEGRSDVTQGDLRPLRLRGDVTLAGDRVAAERLSATFDGKTVTGRLAYDFAAAGRAAKLDAALNAPELDIDAALAFGNALIAGSPIERPHDMTLALDIGRATIAGLSARDASARLKVDASGLQIDRLAVANLGGAAFSASGRIVTAGPSPQGSVRVHFEAPDMMPAMALLARFSPQTAQALRGSAAAMAPAKLNAVLSVNGAAPATATLSVDGSLGKVRVALNGRANANPIALTAGDLHLDGKLETGDGRLLVTMLGLDRALAVEAGPGALTLNAEGPARGDLKIDGKLTAGGLEASANGTAKLFADNPSAVLHATIAHADAAPLRGRGHGGALPVTFAGNVALTGKELTLSGINATVAGAAVRGKLDVGLPSPRHVQGDIGADNVDVADLVAAAIGMPAATGGGSNWTWSDEPFSGGLFGDYSGEISLKARRADLPAHLTARELRATLHLGKNELSFEDIAGEAAGGRLVGALSFRADGGGVKAHAKLALAGADAANLLGSGARPLVTGSLGFSAEADGAGLSPAALIGSLQGTGKIGLSDAQFAGLDPRAFDAVTRAVDRGLPINQARISGVVGQALDSGRLTVKRAEGAIAVSAGQLRLTNVSIDSTDAALSLSGNLDLTDGSLDARLVLSGSHEAAGARPDIFMALQGPLAAPARSIDVSALTGWLTLRQIENQSKQIHEIENAQPQPNARPPKPKSEQAPPLPPPLNIRPLPAPPRSGEASVGTQSGR